jgi:hypothetical protein
MTKDWKLHQHEITRLYIDEGRTLRDVQSIMKNRYDFQASIRSYRAHFDEWRIGKYKCKKRPDRLILSPSATPMVLTKTTASVLGGVGVGVGVGGRYGRTSSAVGNAVTSPRIKYEPIQDSPELLQARLYAPSSVSSSSASSPPGMAIPPMIQPLSPESDTSLDDVYYQTQKMQSRGNPAGDFNNASYEPRSPVEPQSFDNRYGGSSYHPYFETTSLPDSGGWPGGRQQRISSDNHGAHVAYHGLEGRCVDISLPFDGAWSNRVSFKSH